MYLSLDASLPEICNNYLSRYDDNYFIPIKNGQVSDHFFSLTIKDPNVLQVFKWGYPGSKGKIYHYVAEKGIVKHPVFLHAIRKSRCIIPVTSFNFKTKEGIYNIRLEDRKIFSLAGLYIDDKFCLITVSSNKIIAPYCDFMPIVLLRGGEQTWLKGTSVLSNITSLLYPFDHMKMRVNNFHPFFNSNPQRTSPSVRKKEENSDKKPWWGNPWYN